MSELFKKSSLPNDTISSVGDLEFFFKSVEKEDTQVVKKYFAEDDFKYHPYYEEILKTAFLHACTKGYKEMVKEIIELDVLDYKNNYPLSVYQKGLVLCVNNAHLQLVDYLLSSIIPQENHYRQYQLNTALHAACQSGHENIVKHLLNNSDYKSIIDIHSFDDKALNNALTGSHFEIVKFLLETASFKNKKNINDYYYSTFLLACYQGDLELLKYLISNDKIQSYNDIKNLFCMGLTDACLKGMLNVVTFLLTNDDTKHLVDIHTNNDDPFICAYNGKHINVLSFLILEMNIEKTKYINRTLLPETASRSSNSDFLTQVRSLFELREERERLNTEIQPSDTKPLSVRKI